MSPHENVLGVIGATPLVRISRIGGAESAEILVKLELVNPGGSVKDRPALYMVQSAERSGDLQPGAEIVEATSGNTGISLAMIAAARGYGCTLVMPEDMSQTRRYLLQNLGARVVLTPASAGMTGAVERAREILSEQPGAFMPGQFENPANPRAHFETTAEEIWRDTDGRLDAFVAGVGTGGTLTGVAQFLEERLPDCQMIAVEPRGSAVLSGKAPGLHGIQGLGAGFVPPILDRARVDRVITVTDVAADRMVRRLSTQEGISAGPSSGANVHAALQVAAELGPGKRVVTIACDTGERYLA